MVKLSRRQRQIVTMLTRGSTQKTIARELGISYGTVRKHLYSARERADCRTSLELAFKASDEIQKK